MYNKIVKNIQDGCNIDKKNANKILSRFDIFGFLVGIIINKILSSIFKIDNILIFIIVIIITTILSLIYANKNKNNLNKLEKISNIMKIISFVILGIIIIGIIIGVFFIN